MGPVQKNQSTSLLPLGALLGSALLVIGEPQLLATHNDMPALRSGPHFLVDRLGYPEPP